MLVAAAILCIGGGVILVRAGLDRYLSPRGPLVPAAIPESRDDQSTSAFRDGRKAGRLITAALSAGPASIHLGAGPEHVATMGDLGLAFYAAAIFQTAFAWAWLTSDAGPRLARIGIAANTAFIAIWLWSRTAGLPGTSIGPEAIGLADAITVAMQIALIIVLAIAIRGAPRRLVGALPRALVPSIVTTGLVAGLGIVALSTAIALVDLGQGHGHAAVQHDAASDGH